MNYIFLKHVSENVYIYIGHTKDNSNMGKKHIGHLIGILLWLCVIFKMALYNRFLIIIFYDIYCALSSPHISSAVWKYLLWNYYNTAN